MQTQSGVTFMGACFEETPTALRAVKEPPASPHLPFCEGLVNKNSRVPVSVRPCPVAAAQCSTPSKSPPILALATDRKKDIKRRAVFFSVSPLG